MKKIMTALVLMTVAGGTLANNTDTLKINTIKSMYQMDMKKQDNQALVKFADTNLKKAFQKQDQYESKRGELCGPDYVLLWQSQDPDYSEKRTYSITKAGNVNVKLSNRANVTFVMNCTGNSCKISDVLSDGSVIKLINQECS